MRAFFFPSKKKQKKLSISLSLSLSLSLYLSLSLSLLLFNVHSMSLIFFNNTTFTTFTQKHFCEYVSESITYFFYFHFKIEYTHTCMFTYLHLTFLSWEEECKAAWQDAYLSFHRKWSAVEFTDQYVSPEKVRSMMVVILGRPDWSLSSIPCGSEAFLEALHESRMLECYQHWSVQTCAPYRFLAVTLLCDVKKKKKGQI